MLQEVNNTKDPYDLPFGHFTTTFLTLNIDILGEKNSYVNVHISYV
jgi:hypothetical protein